MYPFPYYNNCHRGMSILDYMMLTNYNRSSHCCNYGSYGYPYGGYGYGYGYPYGGYGYGSYGYGYGYGYPYFH